MNKTLHALATVKTIKGRMLAIASDGAVDRDGEIIDPSGWDLKNFKANPVLLWAHQSTGLPIGTAENIGIKTMDGEKKLVFSPVFHDITPEAIAIGKMYESGILTSFSVGFRPLESDGTKYTKQELLEISGVPVPANQNARVIAKAAGISEKMAERIIKGDVEVKENKSVIPFKATPMASEDMAWNGSAQVKQATPEQLKMMCAWYDSEKPDIKSSYKLPHHLVDGKVVWRGVASAMGVMMGSMGGVDMPEADRKGVYNHLAKHYKQFDKEAPSFKSIEEQVCKNIMIEPEIVEVKTTDEQLAQIDTRLSNIEATIKSLPLENNRPTPQNGNEKKARLGKALQNIVSALNQELKN